MNQTSIPDLDVIFKRIPLLSDHQVKDFQIRRLAGFTNYNFHIKNKENDWVLRIPKEETNQYINRKAESHNTEIAWQIGLAPECVWSDISGLSLSKTLNHTRCVSPFDFQNQVIFESVVSKIKYLHQHKTEFIGTVDLDKLLIRYFQLMPKTQQQKTESEYLKVKKIIKQLAQQDKMTVPSHNDLVLENILINNAGQSWFIDWEYSSMASPYWDLATLSNAADFDTQQMQSLLAVYNSKTQALKLDLLMDYRNLLNFLFNCWMVSFTLMD